LPDTYSKLIAKVDVLICEFPQADLVGSHYSLYSLNVDMEKLSEKLDLNLFHFILFYFSSIKFYFFIHKANGVSRGPPPPPRPR
jgi:hypothetical protein